MSAQTPANARPSPFTKRISPLPRTLFARVSVILLVGLVIAQGAAFWLTMTERDQSMIDVMTGYVEREVTSSVALLDHLPPSERSAWLPKLARRSYDFILGPGVGGATPDAALSERFAGAIADGIGKQYPLTVNVVSTTPERFQVHLTLTDGSPLTIDMRPIRHTPLSSWLPAVLCLQLIALAGCGWFAVRLATRPLENLAKAADALGPDLKGARLAETGPEEVVRASIAFNAMQDRVAMYMAQRMQILASITHDLQTPITRMRLRVDVMDDDTTGAKLRQDLQEMESLVKEGITYARTLHGTQENAVRVDPDALFSSIVDDYTDAGQSVSLDGRIGHPIVTRPQAIRRILCNLIDNALKFSNAAEVTVQTRGSERACISVLDRGPGIPEASLEAVFEPFVRLETSRNRQTGGTGLGLAIARQLAQTCDATLTLHCRDGGGLEARLVLNTGAA